MKIVITGGSGLIGQAFIEEYSDKHDIIAIGRSDTDYSSASLSRFLRGADVLINLAGIRFSRVYEANHLVPYLENVVLMENLLTSCASHNLSNFVFASSISVYSAEDKQPWIENAPCNPGNYYGLSKLLCERIGAFYAGRYGIKVKNLRFAQVLSDREREGFLLRTVFDNAKAGNGQTIFGTGEGTRCYVYIRDAAHALMAAAEHPNECGSYNIAAPDPISIKDLIATIDRVFGNASPATFLSGKPEDLNTYAMDVEAAKTVLGYQTMFSIEDAIQDIYTNEKRLDKTVY